MKPSFLPLHAALIFLGSAALLSAQNSPYRGLWVGEATLGAVNEVSIPLDENNIPRAPDPNIPTPTSDAANLRLILHVDATGQVRLLKHVAILARKAGIQQQESDLALVTDERLYGAFPPQPAQRISSVSFDFGDAQATNAVDELTRAAADGAATAAAVSGATTATVTAAARSKAAPIISQADSAAQFTTFQQTALDKTKVTAIANGDAAALAAAQAAAGVLQAGSFVHDTRAVEMVAAVQAAAAVAPASGKVKAALQAAAAFADVDNGYDRFLASEALGDMIAKAAVAAASASDAAVLKPVTSFAAGPTGTTNLVSPAHGLVTGDEIALLTTGLAARDGFRIVTRVDANVIRIAVPPVAGGLIGGYAGAIEVAPVTIDSPAHGLETGARITVRDSNSRYNGNYLVSVTDAGHFTIDTAYISGASALGFWINRAGDIGGYQGTGSGATGILVTAANHGLNDGQKIEIRGAGEPSYNGVKTITRVDANHFSIVQPFGTDPQVKGRWEIPVPIAAFAPPATVETVVTAAGHGLAEGDRIIISGAGNAAYNGVHVISAVSANAFSIPIVFASAGGNPAVKGTWAPLGTGLWRKVSDIRTATNATPEVATARTQGGQSAISRYDDTRATDAVTKVLEAIIRGAALQESSLSAQTAYLAAQAGREELANGVARFTKPLQVPSTDYTEFVRSTLYKNSVDTAATAAAAGALAEKKNLLATPASIRDKALQAAIEALAPVYAAASRSLLTALPMTGDFGPGGAGLSTEIVLPANHPTNPFRHRRHPDHTTGFDIRRVVQLAFASGDSRPTGRSGYGVERISGIYNEEIFGLHKPLGPLQNTGLKVRGSFELHRISLIDTLNGR